MDCHCRTFKAVLFCIVWLKFWVWRGSYVVSIKNDPWDSWPCELTKITFLSTRKGGGEVMIMVEQRIQMYVDSGCQWIEQYKAVCFCFGCCVSKANTSRSTAVHSKPHHYRYRHSPLVITGMHHRWYISDSNLSCNKPPHRGKGWTWGQRHQYHMAPSDGGSCEKGQSWVVELWLYSSYSWWLQLNIAL